jgi:outer membrane protein assembly factor BamA
VQPSFDVRQTPGRAWLRYGATAEGFVDLTGTQRVLSLAVAALLTDTIQGREDVPFTEQVTLGGPTLMRGFLPGRLIGRSAVVATLQYRWPIWIWMDGALQFAVGNVFGERMRDFDPSLLRLSSTIGFTTSNSPENQLEVLAGFGTETFAAGAPINSFRVAFGGTHGF